MWEGMEDTVYLFQRTNIFLAVLGIRNWWLTEEMSQVQAVTIQSGNCKKPLTLYILHFHSFIRNNEREEETHVHTSQGFPWAFSCKRQ